jgi:CDP-4-dehydro-6-deoxyglucose reductase/ferredoxin-NAD(P)+ reductase (naphthalene dioxygenase ferredoxin-specific)
MTRIKFHCSSPVTVDAEWDETVLDALVRSGTPVPFFCRSGICGQCKSVLAAGELMEIGTAPRILTQEEIDRGMVLICRSIAVEDCEIVPLNLPREAGELPWPDEVDVVEAGWSSQTLFHLRVAVPADGAVATFLFHPGQYSHVRAPQRAHGDLPSRLYPATRPGHAFLDFHLTPRDPRQAAAFGDVFRVGARLRLARPVGASSLKEGERGPAVLVAHAEGLPAVLSMLALLRMRDDRSGLHVVVRGDGDGPLEREVVGLCEAGGIDLRFADADGVRAALEFVADAVAATPCRSGRRPQAYVKGDESLVRASREVFYARGMKPWEVHAEILEGIVPSL